MQSSFLCVRGRDVRDWRTGRAFGAAVLMCFLRAAARGVWRGEALKPERFEEYAGRNTGQLVARCGKGRWALPRPGRELSPLHPAWMGWA